VRRLRIALETQFAYGTPTGLGVYARSLAAALKATGDIDLVELRDEGSDVWRFDRRLYWDQFRAPALAAAARADLVHFTGGTLPMRPPHPCVLSVHDLAWLHDAVSGRPYARWYFGALQASFARRADLIVTDTQVMRRQIIASLDVADDRVVVCGCGIDPSWFDVKREPATPPYLLCVGTVEERKDLITLVRSLVDLPHMRLVSAGPHTLYAGIVRGVASESAVADRVDLLGFVDDAALRSLYAGATAFVFPSRYEGFGLPPLQALAAGVPVVAADIPVLREVLGPWARYGRPGDPASFAQQVRALAGDPGRARELAEGGRQHAAGFTWQAVAHKLIALYRSLAPASG
jgi:glycosyltransferase involved in cell wall biosynthesis